VAFEREVAEGRLVVSTDAAAGITVDGAVVGLGRWQGVLPVGSHRVRVSASGMVPYDAEVAIVANETRSLEISLQHQAGDVSPVWWIGGSILAAAGLGVGGYFLLRPSQTTAGAATPGTISPYTITIQVHR